MHSNVETYNIIRTSEH